MKLQNLNTRPNRTEIRIVRGGPDLEGSLRLRYRVFVQELGASASELDHVNKFERDYFDSYCEHIVLVDPSVDPETRNHVIGTMRLLRGCEAKRAGGYYSETEFDLTALHKSKRSLLEIGRACVHPNFRGYNLMSRFWKTIVKIFNQDKIEILFGTASFHGTDLESLKIPLSYLYHQHFAPADLRAVVHSKCGHQLTPLALSETDMQAAYGMLPTMLKSYLRLGGVVGNGVWVDEAFNTTDTLIIIDTKNIARNYLQNYTTKTA